MRKLFMLSICCLFLAACGDKGGAEPKSDDTHQKEEVTVKVMTYNIWGAKSGGRTMAELEAIAEVIKKVNPDLVALQEVDRHTTRNAALGDMAKKLGEMTDMDYFFAKAENFYGGEYGDAVLSKLPIKEKKGYNLDVDHALGGEVRSVARVLVEKEGKEFYFISTHFDHLSDERNRIKQANDFVTLAQTFDKPIIVGSDFNARPNSNTMDILRTHFTLGCLAGNCNQFTFSTMNPDRTIDYLIYTPQSAFSTKLYTVTSWANQESDHFPVEATFILNF